MDLPIDTFWQVAHLFRLLARTTLNHSVTDPFFLRSNSLAQQGKLQILSEIRCWWAERRRTQCDRTAGHGWQAPRSRLCRAALHSPGLPVLRAEEWSSELKIRWHLFVLLYLFQAVNMSEEGLEWQILAYKESSLPREWHLQLKSGCCSLAFGASSQSWLFKKILKVILSYILFFYPSFPVPLLWICFKWVIYISMTSHLT